MKWNSYVTSDTFGYASQKIGENKTINNFLNY